MINDNDVTTRRPRKAEGSAVERSAMRRITLRLVLLLFVVYIFNYLDRTNIGIAKLHLQPDLGLSEAAYGLGAGLFFVGYVIFEVPSNVILYKVGARLWIARIMVTWGLVAMGMAFVQDEWSFYVLRFLLGVAEAGLVPGVILYLTQWIPSVRRARMIGIFYLAVPLSTVLGAPLSSWLMGFTPFGVDGWRFMFFVEGLPCLFIAVLVLRYLTDRPADADWLSDEERGWLIGELEKEETAESQHGHRVGSLFGALRDVRVLGMSVVYFSMIIPIYALAFFLPTIVDQMGSYSTLQIGFITAVPYVFASAGLVLLARRSDRLGERTYHYAVPAAVGAAGLVLAAFTLSTSPVLALLGFSLGAIGCISTLPCFWSETPKLLTGMAAAAGIALISSIGNIAGFVAPYMVALIKGEDGSMSGSTNAVLVCGAFLALAAVVMVAVGRSVAAAKRRTAVLVSP
ncbi:MFS transporter [Ornithinimicrobium cavernae]|uniref:MFS transporter n=1 Tax=Ornithinimicrobium cavernae TaxID=2666047 RepID=UPI000D69C527|nr:MFS transporter [Ornithinimicrobium cavernae]